MTVTRTPPIAVPIAADEALRVEGMAKIYPKRPGQAELTTVQDISFRLAKGEILGLLGPNGAGKTTTIKMIAGLVKPTSGQIYIGPYAVGESRSSAVYRLGAVLEGNRNLHWRLTVLENLTYFGTLKGIRGIKAKARAIALRLDLGDHLKKRVGQLSRGLQQRVGTLSQFTVMLVFGFAMIPLESLPKWMEPFVNNFPFTKALLLLRELTVGEGVPLRTLFENGSITSLAINAAVFLGLGCAVFFWAEGKAREWGTLNQY